MESRQQGGQAGEVPGLERAALAYVVEARLLVEAMHLHRRLAVEIHDIEIEPGREATVEAQFCRATGAALFRRAVVEEGQLERLLELVGEFAGKQHPRNVGLDQLDVRHRVRVARRVEQGSDQGRRIVMHEVHYGPGRSLWLMLRATMGYSPELKHFLNGWRNDGG